MKIVESWSKPDLGKNFIARKKVDWSIFEYGTHIPLQFIEYFVKANGGENIALGEKHDIILIIEGIKFEANISNIDRKSFDNDTVQIRYNSNNDLKTFLISKLQKSYNYLNSERAKKKEMNDKSKTVVPDSLAEYLDFYETDKPFCYSIEITRNIQQDNLLINIWWVNQGATLNKAKDERCLWAPIKNKGGKTQYHWETMKELKIGDLVLHYAGGSLKYISTVQDETIEATIPNSLKGNDWNQQGRLVHVDYNDLNPSIPLNKISQALLKLNIKEGPIDSKGGVKQGYLFRFTKEALQIIQKLTPETNWPSFSKLDIDNEAPNEAVQTIIENNNIENAMVDFDIKAAIDRITLYIKSKGYTYEDDLIKNFYLSLKSKPFVILAGTSGTGKSKLVKLFAEAVGATSGNGRYKLVPVKPDWSDSTDLLGYRDLGGKFHPGLLTSFIRKAMDDIENPYFICLDEMNLARVEYYFSDILSVMETRTNDKERIKTDKLLAEELFGDNVEAKKIYQDIYIPENLYIIGTVNMDETTFPFSKKVLDRANTIEFSKVDFDYSFNKNPEIDSIMLNNEFFKSQFLRLDDCGQYEEIVQKVITILKNINEVLMNSNLYFGYRIRDEICYYTIYNEKNNLVSFNEAMDNEILQKILPRIQGSSAQIKKAIIDLFKICIDNDTQNFNDEGSGINGAMHSYIEGNPSIPYKKSASKLEFMMRRFEEDGFTSYWL